MIHLVRDGAGTDEDKFAARRHHVSPGYLATLGIPLLRGRDFADTDVADGPRVTIVSERFANAAWPGKDAVGQRLRVEGSNTELRVIGVSGDVEHGGLQADDTPQVDVYLSTYQSPPRSPSLVTLFVRTSRPTTQVLDPMNAALREMDPALPFYDVQTMEARLAGQTTTARLLIAIMGTFAALGLLLAAVGIYGVVAFAVGQRGREIAVHMALGATPGGIARRVVRQGLAPVLVGVVVGTLVVLALTRFLMSLLYGLSPLDPATLATTTVLLLAVAALASWLPARRAARVQPNEVLRSD
jgi:predicted permease